MRLGHWVLGMLLLVSLLPGIAAAARALSPLTPAWALVCTAQGMQWLALDEAGAAQTDGTGQDDSEAGPTHCVLCRLAADLPPAPPRALACLICGTQEAQQISWRGTAPLPPRHIQLMAAPRAPPG